MIGLTDAIDPEGMDELTLLVAFEILSRHPHPYVVSLRNEIQDALLDLRRGWRCVHTDAVIECARAVVRSGTRDRS